jgi:fatty acid synthase subunit alpha, fungi type
VGGTVLVINPRYLLGAVEPSLYEAYKLRNRERALSCYKAMTSMMTTNSLVKIKDAPPYSPELEVPVLLNSMARATLDQKSGSYSFPKKLTTKATYDVSNVDAAVKALGAAQGTMGVGVDHGTIILFFIMLRFLHSYFPELISSVPSNNPTFVSRNFTDAEVAYCRSQPSPASSFAARWAGKEAVFKALGVSSKGAGAALKDIEILPDEKGVPTVTLLGEAKSAAADRGIGSVHVSLSHSETVAIAFAQAVSGST